MTRFRIKYVNLAGEQATTEIEAAQQPDIAEASRLLAERGIGHLQCLDVQSDLVDWARGRTADTIAANRVSGQQIRRLAVGGAITLVLLVVIASATVYGIGRYETWKRWSSFPHTTSACSVDDPPQPLGPAVRDISTRPDVPHLTEVTYTHNSGDALTVTTTFDRLAPEPPSSPKGVMQLGMTVYLHDTAGDLTITLDNDSGEWRSDLFGTGSDVTIEILQAVRYSGNSVTFELDLAEYAELLSRPVELETRLVAGMALSPLPSLLIGTYGENCQWESTASSATEATDEQSPVADPTAIFDRDDLVDVPCIGDGPCQIASPGRDFVCYVSSIHAACIAPHGEALVDGVTATSPGNMTERPVNFMYVTSFGETTLRPENENSRTAESIQPFDYGHLRKVSAHGYTCVTDAKPSEAVSCRHDESGHGFKVSRQAYETF